MEGIQKSSSKATPVLGSETLAPLLVLIKISRYNHIIFHVSINDMFIGE